MPGPAEVPRVRTVAGAILEAVEVVCCAGRWVPELVAMAGAASPVPLIDWEKPGATAPGLVVRVGPLASAGPVHLVHTPEICLRPHSGGLLHLEAPDAAVDLHTPESDLRRWAATLLRRARRPSAASSTPASRKSRSASAPCEEVVGMQPGQGLNGGR